MSTILEAIFLEIKKRVKTIVPEITDVQMYQKQDLFQSKSLGFKPPIVFVEYINPIDYDDLGNDLQEALLNISIKVVVEEYTKNYFKALSFGNRVAKALHNFSEWTYPMLRTSENTDTNADSLYVFEIIFSTKFKEDLLSEYDTSEIEFEISLLMESNGDGVYTDHSSSGTSGTNFII